MSMSRSRLSFKVKVKVKVKVKFKVNFKVNMKVKVNVDVKVKVKVNVKVKKVKVPSWLPHGRLKLVEASKCHRTKTNMRLGASPASLGELIARRRRRAFGSFYSVGDIFNIRGLTGFNY